MLDPDSLAEVPEWSQLCQLHLYQSGILEGFNRGNILSQVRELTRDKIEYLYRVLDTVLERKVFEINVKANVSKPFDAVRTNWNHHENTLCFIRHIKPS